ncbi:hypothetical protein VTI74DRAFT_7261 [Chaetomium olivicolor]
MCEEEIHAEVLVMRFPEILVLFIRMEHIENAGNFLDFLAATGRPLEAWAFLDPNIAGGLLNGMYGQMADIVLQLSLCEFSHIDCIGSIQESYDYDGHFDIAPRPLSFITAQLEEMGAIPHFRVPPEIETEHGHFKL